MFVKLLVIVAVVFSVASPSGAGEEFEPTWESLNSRECPEWFPAAKFGIFIHWGVYSVPAWSPKGTYSEWYLYWLRKNAYKGAVRKFHGRVYGKDFKYRQFAPKFTCELFDPAQWADIFKRAGARYVVLTSKHHDGYCLWPAPDAQDWNSVDVGPGRDLCGDLAEAVRAEGLKMGFYYSLYEWFHPLYKSKQLKKYVDTHMMPQIKDLVKRYEPAVIFSDGEWEQSWKVWRSTEFLAWLYNEGPNPDEVVVDDRWGKGMRGKCGDYYTTEYGKHAPKKLSEMTAVHPWEECRGIGGSFGYNRNETIDEYRTGPELVRLLIDLVGNGGNLLLDIGPTGDGRIPVIMQDRLLFIGRWLKANGEAIYGTRGGPVTNQKWGSSTRKGDNVYLLVYNWPDDGELTIPALGRPVKRACLLADKTEALDTDANADELNISVPARGTDPTATVIVLEMK